MFTGIIEELGEIRQITSNHLEIECKSVLEGSEIGDSIAVNGVCLTAAAISKDGFIADISPETLKVTSLGYLKTGDRVNLERAMGVNGRFGGHIVSGHIDDVGKGVNVEKVGDFYNISIEIPQELTKYIVKKGSIAINGISLTVAEIKGKIITIAVIPHTYDNTNLQTLKVGDFVNIEVDVLAKYIEKFLSTSDNRSRIDYDFLAENGF